MVARVLAFRNDPGLRNMLDWTVFGIGAVSLSIAIAATILGPPRPGNDTDTAAAEIQSS